MTGSEQIALACIIAALIFILRDAVVLLFWFCAVIVLGLGMLIIVILIGIIDLVTWPWRYWRGR